MNLSRRIIERIGHHERGATGYFLHRSGRQIALTDSQEHESYIMSHPSDFGIEAMDADDDYIVDEVVARGWALIRKWTMDDGVWIITLSDTRPFRSVLEQWAEELIKRFASESGSSVSLQELGMGGQVRNFKVSDIANGYLRT